MSLQEGWSRLQDQVACAAAEQRPLLFLDISLFENTRCSLEICSDKGRQGYRGDLVMCWGWHALAIVLIELQYMGLAGNFPSMDTSYRV